MTEEREYAVVVLYFRAGEVLARTLQRIAAQTVRAREVVVVDNASGDGVAAAVVGALPDVRLLVLPENAGYSGGMNAGLAHLRSDSGAVLFLTHETLLDPDCAALLLNEVAAGASIAGPVLLRQRDRSVWSSGGGLTRWGRAVHPVRDEVTAGSGAYDVEWLDGAALMIDRSALRSAGGFDERYFLYWEDVDISLRLSRYGAVRCVSDAVAEQETGEAAPYFSARNRIQVWRHHDRPGLVLAAVVGESLRAASSLMRHRRARDAAGRLLGVYDGLTGGLRTQYGKLRSRRPSGSDPLPRP